MLPFIAVPLLHSSGAWIASTAAGGYVAGTLCSTWVGAFIAGNAGILSALGITSAAGVVAAIGGGLSSVGPTLGGGLATSGLAGVAQGLGLAPATFLGLTVTSWALVATSVIIVLIGYFFATKKLTDINRERTNGGLVSLTWSEIIAEVRYYDKQALINILERLQEEFKGEIVVNRSDETVMIKNISYRVNNLKYVIKKNGEEYIALRRRFPFRALKVFMVKGRSI